MPTRKKTSRDRPSAEGRDADLLRVQELFHGLIRSRAQEGNISVPRRLPKLSRDMLTESEPRWFPVPGMYGGFSIRLREVGGVLQLTAESWCRVAGGSGQRHAVTPTQVILEEAGFV